jgi:two-component system cell cycle response regulator DivK
MKKTILVVEDQEDNRQILRDLLGSAGFLMIEAHDGEQALTVARSQRPDLILMDIPASARRWVRGHPQHKARS